MIEKEEEKKIEMRRVSRVKMRRGGRVGDYN